MKTLFKTYTSYLKAIEKRKWFQRRTGNGMRFSLIVTTQTPVDDSLAEKLLPFLTVDYQGFVNLSVISNMSIPDVLIAAQTLVRNNQALLGTNRMGNFAAIRAKTKYELCLG